MLGHMFINFSNHPSSAWLEAQKEAAHTMYGEIRDIPFPIVPVNYQPEEIHALAVSLTAAIQEALENGDHKPNAVMCQGKFTLCYSVISLLQKAGITVVSAVTERHTSEKVEAGKVIKTSSFDFGGFREYFRE